VVKPTPTSTSYHNEPIAIRTALNFFLRSEVHNNTKGAPFRDCASYAVGTGPVPCKPRFYNWEEARSSDRKAQLIPCNRSSILPHQDGSTAINCAEERTYTTPGDARASQHPREAGFPGAQGHNVKTFSGQRISPRRCFRCACSRTRPRRTRRRAAGLGQSRRASQVVDR
jgi:hypothetical protein